MNNKGFVFSGMAFLLIIPAVILAASLLNMVEYGSKGVELTITGDEIFYNCNNLMNFLQDGARYGMRNYTLEQARIYANKTGINFTYSLIGGSETNYTIIVQSASGVVCNKTVELKYGSLIVNLTLLNSYAFSSGVPVYLRNMTMPFITLVKYSNGSAASNASVLVELLGINRSWRTNSTGHYYNNTVYIPNTTSNPSVFNPPYDNSRTGCPECPKCVRKEPLGSRTAIATASLTNWYDGTDEEQFYIYGNITGSVRPEKSGSKLDVWITLNDQYNDPVTMDCNYTSYPSIVMRINEENGATKYYYYSINGSGTSCTQAAPCDIDESGTETGIYHISSSQAKITYDEKKNYYAYVNATRTDYYPYTGARTPVGIYAVEFVDNVTYGTAECPGSKYGMYVTAVNNGTQSIDNVTIVFQYNLGANWSTYGTYFKSGGGGITSPRGTNETIKVCSSSTSPEFGNARLFANVTIVYPRNDATNNTYSCGVYGASGVSCPPT